MMSNQKVFKLGLALAVAIMALAARGASADPINIELSDNLRDATGSGKQLLALCFAGW